MDTKSSNRGTPPFCCVCRAGGCAPVPMEKRPKSTDVFKTARTSGFRSGSARPLSDPTLTRGRR